ncbi:DUF4962 domain-containing protein [Paenibacillus sp. 1781tsa1]|uniref:DUF4962 domain-containing protein n=1 Tax=Paenibacillus sp. 1781tsa1 TaxID=2953810 RepID=UPI00209D6C10|nr:DUF4962 domain-containing protein [Paenibacillus sp. 1781tsa1]MCP1182451.1 DUF4962 domain-containing protein [Paenibacillus sp. 1781tsa1]
MEVKRKLAERPLYQPISGPFHVDYAPDEHTVLAENPPRFTWMAAQQEDENAYLLQVSASPSFQEEETMTYTPLPYNFFTPDRVFEPGEYYWRYALLIDHSVQQGSEADVDVSQGKQGSEAEGHPSQRKHGEMSAWSEVRRFMVPAGLPETPLPSRAQRYVSTDTSHPRLWLGERGLNALADGVASDSTYCGWDVFMANSVEPWANREPIREPLPYPENKRVATLWRQMYIDCQEVLYAIRHLSIAGRVLRDERLLEAAKTWLLHVAAWDTEGTTSRDYNDEAAFRVAAALAWGYDWLHDELNSEEQDVVRCSLLRRTEQVTQHVMVRSKIHHVPYDSHAIRSLSSVLVPCCMAMMHEEQQAAEWLDYAIDYYACLYSPWGGSDGGWAEGPMYWTTGMAYVTEAMNLLRNYAGIDFFRRPFFQRTGDFPFYVYPPDARRASFGDQSTLGDPVNLKTGYLVRQLAGVTGNRWYQWYFERVRQSDPGTEGAFYNYGWWDFNFDELVYRHDYPQVEEESPVNIEPLKWFRDVGWVAMHHRMDDPDEHVMLLLKSSRYGSISHSHADQNSFTLHAFGEPLAADTGYYIAHGSSFHREWRRQTRSKNNLLIGGVGQYAENNKVLNMAATGQIEDAYWRDGDGYVRALATDAYASTVPHVKRVVREIHFLQSSYFVIVDHIDLDKPDSVQWLFHALHPLQLKGQSFRLNGTKAGLEGTFVYASSGELSLSQTNQFAEVDPAEYEGLDRHYHLSAETRPATSHTIVTLLVPYKIEEPKYVPYFIDDQDHGIHLYFTDNGVTKKIEVSKTY